MPDIFTGDSRLFKNSGVFSSVESIDFSDILRSRKAIQDFLVHFLYLLIQRREDGSVGNPLGVGVTLLDVGKDGADQAVDGVLL